MEDLADLPTVRFTQERMSIYTIQRTCRHQRELPDVQCDRPCYFEWYFERTDAHATGSGF